jgi:hypothetical protein
MNMNDGAVAPPVPRGFRMNRRTFAFGLLLVATAVMAPHRPVHAASDEKGLRVAVFSADVTIPLGHRCMGILPQKAARIDDPLEAHGFVLLGAGPPVVLAALDWCEVRNGAYDHWREALAEAAGTTRERVLVCCLHQHDAPVVDTEAQALLDAVGLQKELCDPEFNEACVRRVADALRASLGHARSVTHLGVGQADVEQVASNRRVVLEGRVTFDRYSASGAVPKLAEAPDGEIDAALKTLSFWDGDTPVLAVHCYAVHPMSFYGKGGVSADFVGLARRRRAADDPRVAQIYLTGCAGDVTAGKYNDGSPAMRPVLADRIYAAMRKAWDATRRIPVGQVTFRNATADLPFHEGAGFMKEVMETTLRNPAAATADRILAAMGLASLDRLRRGVTIDVPCIDFGPAQLLLLPGESFVGYQLFAQRGRPDSSVLTPAYGQCWPGYIPTQAAFGDGFNHDWRWCGPGSDERLREAIGRALAGRR